MSNALPLGENCSISERHLGWNSDESGSDSENDCKKNLNPPDNAGRDPSLLMNVNRIALTSANPVELIFGARNSAYCPDRCE
jgi:hypothetical protein